MLPLIPVWITYEDNQYFFLLQKPKVGVRVIDISHLQIGFQSPSTIVELTAVGVQSCRKEWDTYRNTQR